MWECLLPMSGAFNDTVTDVDVGMERGSVVPVHPSTELTGETL
jgi:hypothetical protein